MNQSDRTQLIEPTKRGPPDEHDEHEKKDDQENGRYVDRIGEPVRYFKAAK